MPSLSTMASYYSQSRVHYFSRKIAGCRSGYHDQEDKGVIRFEHRNRLWLRYRGKPDNHRGRRCCFSAFFVDLDKGFVNHIEILSDLLASILEKSAFSEKAGAHSHRFEGIGQTKLGGQREFRQEYLNFTYRALCNPLCQILKRELSLQIRKTILCSG